MSVPRLKPEGEKKREKKKTCRGVLGLRQTHTQREHHDDRKQPDLAACRARGAKLPLIPPLLPYTIPHPPSPPWCRHDQPASCADMAGGRKKAPEVCVVTQTSRADSPDRTLPPTLTATRPRPSLPPFPQQLRTADGNVRETGSRHVTVPAPCLLLVVSIELPLPMRVHRDERHRLVASTIRHDSREGGVCSLSHATPPSPNLYPAVSAQPFARQPEPVVTRARDPTTPRCRVPLTHQRATRTREPCQASSEDRANPAGTEALSDRQG